MTAATAHHAPLPPHHPPRSSTPPASTPACSKPYVDYQSIDLLLSLQHPHSGGYDERCFVVMGQIQELLFKALHFELHNARLQIEVDALDNAADILPRTKALAEYIGRSWDVLSTIRPEGFNQYRRALGTASGQLSFMYRHVEFILGNKNARLASAVRNRPHVWPAMTAALNSPSLYDEVIRLLARQGLAIAPQALARDGALPRAPDATVEAAWVQVYANPSSDNKLYKLAEALVQVADVLSPCRWRHFMSVQRLIGLKPGTGGSAGVGSLQHVSAHRFFPELWSVRRAF